ncbi:hypothetical protein AB1Y20_022393 [Prymnesium parvum]|uniref:Uncharacterized protein n=1 Tax=Prymnesium parvum TaxID=97485 RepID=A0AB34JJE0_PRYPA
MVASTLHFLSSSSNSVCFVVNTTHATCSDRWDLTRKAALLLCKSASERTHSTSQGSEWWQEHTSEFALMHVRSHAPSADWVCIPTKFTSDATAFAKRLKNEIAFADGLADSAALLEALLAAIHGVAWRRNAKRHLVLLSHTQPHPLMQAVAEAAAANMGLLPLNSCWSPVPEALAAARISLSVIALRANGESPSVKGCRFTALYDECCRAAGEPGKEPVSWPDFDLSSRVLIFTSFPPPTPHKPQPTSTNRFLKPENPAEGSQGVYNQTIPTRLPPADHSSMGPTEPVDLPLERSGSASRLQPKPVPPATFNNVPGYRPHATPTLTSNIQSNKRPRQQPPSLPIPGAEKPAPTPVTWNGTVWTGKLTMRKRDLCVAKMVMPVDRQGAAWQQLAQHLPSELEVVTGDTPFARSNYESALLILVCQYFERLSFWNVQSIAMELHVGMNAWRCWARPDQAIFADGKVQRVSGFFIRDDRQQKS